MQLVDFALTYILNIYIEVKRVRGWSSRIIKGSSPVVRKKVSLEIFYMKDYQFLKVPKGFP